MISGRVDGSINRIRFVTPFAWFIWSYLRKFGLWAARHLRRPSVCSPQSGWDHGVWNPSTAVVWHRSAIPFKMKGRRSGLTSPEMKIPLKIDPARALPAVGVH